MDFLEQREEYRYMVGNILYESVPIGETEEENKIERIVGDLPKFSFKPLSHVELAEGLDIIDFRRASKITGSNFILFKKALNWITINIITLIWVEISILFIDP